jgi:hypothetical protein
MLRIQKIFSISILFILMLACAIPNLAPASAPIPTFDVNFPLTAIVLTSNAAATQTQRFAPPTLTPTVTATRTPFPTETPTPTFIFALPTSTVPPTQIQAGASGLDLDCQILIQEPADNAIIPLGSTFTAKWLIANVGIKTWPSDNTDYRYSSGDTLHLQPIYDLEKSVEAGKIIELTVAMQAPNTIGTFSTIWQISIGQERFCSMKITIIVT